MEILIFFIVLAVLVLVHEFGHFYAAKRSGVRVDEFGLGFPPRLWGFKKGETLYSLNAIPFGGFVRIFGENPDEESLGGPESGRAFTGKPRWVQAIILVAGIVMNVLFAWLLFSIAYMSGMTTGVSDQNSAYVTGSHVVVLDALPHSPAAAAGIALGDEILAYRAGGATTTVSGPEVVQLATRASGGKPITFEILRMDERRFVTVAPAKQAGSGAYFIGISMDTVGQAHLPFFLAVSEGGKLTMRLFSGIFAGLYSLIHDALLGRADISGLSGPVGIARLVGDASRLGFAYLLSFTGFISLNLAALNLLPFPALDGGRILFVLIESVRRKRIAPKVANAANAIGFAILVAFMLFVTYRDIVKIWF